MVVVRVEEWRGLVWPRIAWRALGPQGLPPCTAASGRLPPLSARGLCWFVLFCFFSLLAAGGERRSSRKRHLDDSLSWCLYLFFFFPISLPRMEEHSGMFG